jgi:conjugative relaxase-like TrwC/TraI family protein
MLRINQQTNASAAKSYYSSPAEYYRQGEQEIVGLWGGEAAARLDLSGDILRLQFERLCDNRHPFTGDQLTARMRKDRRVGYDFTFDASKSVSILYGLTDDPAILEAFRQAVRATMEEMEAGVKTRVRKRGQFGERIVGNMAWGEFVHFTARPVNGEIDPHLHAHCFVPNICWDRVEHAWKAIDVASVKEDAPYWQAAFQKRFGHRLAGLGYAVEWKGDNFEIAGIDRKTIDRFSLRTSHINQAADKRGITDPRDKDKLGALTRERKAKDATMPQLRARWWQRLTDGERAVIAQAALRQRRPLPGKGGSRHERDEGGRQQRLGDHLMQRQRLAAYERARSSYAPARAAPVSPPPQRSRGYGR